MRSGDADGDGDVPLVHQRHLRGGAHCDVDPFTLDAAGVVDATEFPQTPSTGGSFAFQATYSGDGTYEASTGACEPLTVTPVASSTVTVIHDAAHAPVMSVPAGTVVHDQATVTGGRSGDADGDGDVRLVHQRHLRGRPGGTSDPFTLDAAGVADADDVHADAGRGGELRVPGDVFG